MKIYLDTCSLNRPLDDKSLARNALEATAVLAILAACEQARLTLVSSDILVFENEQNPHPQRRTFVAEVLKTAPDHIGLSRCDHPTRTAFRRPRSQSDRCPASRRSGSRDRRLLLYL
jgi:hypothetical protein